MFRKPETIPLLFIICATALFCSLGSWQVERLTWKQGELKRIELAQSQPALGSLPQDVTGLDYRNVALSGTFGGDHTFHLVGAKQGEGNGFFILTPFALEDDGRIILVNRGFAPPGKETAPEGVQSIRGIIRPARQKRYFSPPNTPEKNVWFFEDIAAMSAASNLPLTPLIVEQTGTPAHGVYPIPGDGKITLRNDHLHYAITWFSFALIGLVMFGFYHRKKP